MSKATRALLVFGLLLAARHADAAQPANCQPGTYSANGREPCTPCAAGTYQDLVQQTSCKACPAGTANPLTGQSSAAACAPCAAGKYGAIAGQGTCSDCAAGTYQDLTGQTSCKNCSAGSANPLTGQASAAACTPCAAGRYGAIAGQGACSDCATGTYQDLTGQTSCKNCSAGTANPLTGQSAASACVPCAAGKFGTATGQSTCQDCPAGGYQDLTGQTSCKTCPAGTANPTPGQPSAAACAPCAAGTFQDLGGQTACRDCPAATYQDATGQTSCKTCPAGTSGSSPAQTSLSGCIPCPAGKFSAAEQATSCTDCPAGSVAANPGSTTCTACTPGTVAAAPGSSACAPCAPGSFQAFAGQSACTSCPADTYQDQAGASACAACPPPQASAHDCRAQICASGVSATVTDDTEVPAPDGLSCTLDTCAGGTATYLPQDASCDDALLCTTDRCDPLAGCTHAPRNCADGNLCTTDACAEPGGCTHTPMQQCCSKDSDCDDGLACTLDECLQESCRNTPQSACLIGGACVAANAADPANECKACKPTTSTASYSNKSKGEPCTDDGLLDTLDVCDAAVCTHPILSTCAIDSTTYPSGTANPLNPCQLCDPASSASEWANRPSGYPCPDDALACTSDACDASGECQHPLVSGCLIEGACVKTGALDPQRECFECRPSAAARDWSQKPAGGPCADDGVACTRDACDASGQCRHPVSGACLIAGACVPDGTPDPKRECFECRPAVSAADWSPAAAGAPCRDDGLWCTHDLCGASPACLHLPRTGCVIGGACVAEGGASPTDPCQVCDSLRSTSAWSLSRAAECAAKPPPPDAAEGCGCGVAAGPLTGLALLAALALARRRRAP